MFKKIAFFLAALVLSAAGCVPGTPDGSGGRVLFQDDFSSPDGRWDVLTDDPQILLDYADGSYRMTALAEGIVFSSVPYGDFPADVRIEVDLSQAAGTLYTAMGIVCRNTYADEGNSMYFFSITKDGTAQISKYVSGRKTELAGDWTVLSAIHSGEAVNRLRVDCIGNRLSLYANGTQLLSVNDDSLVDGDPGLMIGTSDVEDAVVLFDNFVVSAP